MLVTKSDKNTRRSFAISLSASQNCASTLTRVLRPATTSERFGNRDLAFGDFMACRAGIVARLAPQLDDLDYRLEFNRARISLPVLKNGAAFLETDTGRPVRGLRAVRP